MDQEKVLFGKEGWLFLHNDSNDVLLQHTGKRKLSSSELSEWKSLLKERVHYTNSFVAKYVFLVCPDNHSIYPEFLPDNIALVERRPVHEIMDAAADIEGLALLYPLDALVEAKTRNLVCAMSDSHFNFFGAFIVYRELIKKIRDIDSSIFMLDFDDVTFGASPAVGDLGVKFSPPIEGMTVYSNIRDKKAKITFENNINNRGRVTIFENDDKSLPTAVIFRDSYGSYFTQYLAESFSKLVVIASPLMEKEIIETMKPDFIISELAERFLIAPPDDENGDKVTELLLKKGEDALSLAQLAPLFATQRPQ